MYISSRAEPTGLNNNGPLPVGGCDCSGGGASEHPFESPTTEKSEQPFPSPFRVRPRRAFRSTTSLSSSTSVSTSIPTPSTAIPVPVTATNPEVLIPTNGLVPTLDGSGLNSGAIIGVTLGALVAFILVIGFLDVILLSNRIQRIVGRSTAVREQIFRDKQPPPPSQPNVEKQKALPDRPATYYDKEIKHSRTLSLDSSGYSSRYSRSTWGWSGRDGEGTTVRDTREYFRDRKSMDYSRYPVFDEDEDEDDRWVQARASYMGSIQPGMGVQKRHTGVSFFEGIVEDLESGEPVEKVRTGRGRTWMLHDPAERWKRGIHPLTGKRGVEFARIGYY